MFYHKLNYFRPFLYVPCSSSNENFNWIEICNTFYVLFVFPNDMAHALDATVLMFAWPVIG